MRKDMVIGIELGSTRIKSVLIDSEAKIIAQGSYEWENTLQDGLWTYPLEKVWDGLRASYAALNSEYSAAFGENITEVCAIGISAMMHGYLAFDSNDSLLAPFRTWRNTNTGKAADELSELFGFNIPQRWSVAHFYQAVLDREEHVQRVDFLTTLAGYVHYKLTGEKVLGVGDASGMFPISNGDYNPEMIGKFNALLSLHGININFGSMLPRALCAGESAGRLTEEGARLIDPAGRLRAGCLLCPPEGDAGTGMIATNSISPRTANVSAGTSAFLMAVLERELEGYYREIDIVSTPSGAPVAMVHVNNFTSEINAWASLFSEVISLAGGEISRGALFDRLYAASLGADADCGELMGYNFLSGEPIAEVADGRPMLLRAPSGRLTLANFMKMQIYSSLGSLAVGMDILRRERVSIDTVCGHGGFFKAPFVGQSAMSAAVGAPVTVMKSAGEGGAYGVALLALFACTEKSDIQVFLDGVFKDVEKKTVAAEDDEKAAFAVFMEKYKAALPLERAAAEVF